MAFNVASSFCYCDVSTATGSVGAFLSFFKKREREEKRNDEEGKEKNQRHQKLRLSLEGSILKSSRRREQSRKTHQPLVLLHGMITIRMPSWKMMTRAGLLEGLAGITSPIGPRRWRWCDHFFWILPLFQCKLYGGIFLQNYSRSNLVSNKVGHEYTTHFTTLQRVLKIRQKLGTVSLESFKLQ